MATAKLATTNAPTRAAFRSGRLKDHFLALCGAFLRTVFLCFCRLDLEDISTTGCRLRDLSRNSILSSLARPGAQHQTPSLFYL